MPCSNGPDSLIERDPTSGQQAFQSYLKLAQGAYSAATLRALAGDMKQFFMWCRTRGLASLPAEPETVRAYLLELAAVCAATTVRRHLASIAHAHRGITAPDPTKTQAVRLTMRAIARSIGARPNQVAPINADTAEHMSRHIDLSSLWDLRDYAMILVARDLLLRRSELIALDIEDITAGADGSGTALIRHSKSDQSREGAIGWISQRTMAALKRWVESASIKHGAIFRSIDRRGAVGDRLSDRQVARRFKVLAAKIGLNSSNISGQSCRVGMAQDLVAEGAELISVMQAGRWKSPSMPARYAERLLASRGAVAQYYRRNVSSR